MMVWIVFIYFMVVWLWLGTVLEKKKKSSPFVVAFIWALLLTTPVLWIMSAISNNSNDSQKFANTVPNKTVVNPTNAPNTVPSPFRPQIKDQNYKSLDADANTFINRFNAVVLQANQNWALTTANHTSKKQGDKYFGIKFLPTSGTSIGGTVNDDGTIRELLLGIGGGETDLDNLRSITTMLAASIAINHEEPKELVSKTVIGLFQSAMSHPRKASEATIGKYDYTVNYSPELGGMLFAISDAKAGID